MFKLPLIIRNARILSMIAAIGIPGWASAEGVQWAPKQDKGGFTVMAPSINMDVLVDEIAKLKIALKHDEKLLSRQEEQKRTKGSDTVLALLLPGGLLYAAYKKNAHAEAVQAHELVSSRLKEISMDLVAFTAINGPVVVARR